MNVETMESSRRTMLATGLVAAVLASGVGGALLAKHLHESAVDAASVVPVAPVAPAASAPGELTGAAPTRAKRGGPAEKKPLPQNAAPEPAGAAPAVDAGAFAAPEVVVPPGHSPGYVAEDEQIGLVLRRWQEAQLSNDAGLVAESYAPMVDRYFLKSHVNREFVRANLLVQQARGISLRNYQLRHVVIGHVDEDDVEVHFSASFTVDSPGGVRTGDARTELKLHREEGDWKIVYERDYRG